MILTVLAFQVCPPYQVFGPELLRNADFRHGLDAWERFGSGEVRVEEGVLRLGATPPQVGVGVRQILDPGHYRFLALSAELAARDIVPGERPWQRGRLALASLDREGKWVPGPHQAAALEGSRDWHHAQAVLPVPEQAHTLQVRVQLSKATGRLQARHLSLRQARPNPGFLGLQVTAALVWAGMLLWLLQPLVAMMRPRPLDVFIALALGAVLVGTLMPGSLKTGLESALGGWAAALLPGAPVLSVNLMDQVGHFLFFALLTAGAVLALPPTWRLGLLLLLFAALTEVLQLLVAGRMPSLTDLALDVAGMLTGAVLVAGWRHGPMRTGFDRIDRISSSDGVE